MVPFPDNSALPISQVDYSKYILDNFYDGIYIADSNAVTVYLNARYESITGLSKEEMLGRNMKELVESNVISMSGTLYVLETGKPITSEQNFRTGRRALITSTPVFDADGTTMILVITIVREITEMYTIQQEVMRLQQENLRLKNELNAYELAQTMQKRNASPVVWNGEPVNLKLESSKLEAKYMELAYEKYGNVRDAGNVLGMDSSTFVRKRQRYEKLGIFNVEE